MCCHSEQRETTLAQPWRDNSLLAPIKSRRRIHRIRKSTCKSALNTHVLVVLVTISYAQCFNPWRMLQVQRMYARKCEPMRTTANELVCLPHEPRPPRGDQEQRPHAQWWVHFIPSVASRKPAYQETMHICRRGLPRTDLCASHQYLSFTSSGSAIKPILPKM